MRIILFILSVLLNIVLLISCNESDIVEQPDPEPKVAIYMVGVTKSDVNSTYGFPSGWNPIIGLSIGVLDAHSPVDCQNWHPVIQVNNDMNSLIIEDFNCQPHRLLAGVYDKTSGAYDILENTKYTLSVNDNLHPSVNSQYVHPTMIPLKILSVEYDGKGTFDTRYGGAIGSLLEGHYYNLKVELEDPDQPNFYELLVYYRTRGSHTFGTHYILLSFNDSRFIESNTKRFFGLNSLGFDDHLLNGENYTLSLRIFVDEFTLRDIREYEPIQESKVLVALRSYSPALYQYSQDAYNQRISEKYANGSPMPISNIEGGFGVFGGYAENNQSIEVNLVELIK